MKNRDQVLRKSKIQGKERRDGGHTHSLPSLFFSESGVAIVLVTFIVALATIIAVNLTHSTFLASRAVGMVERQLQAEYSLKSLLNLAAAVIELDQDKDNDSWKDPWGIFRYGAPIPREIVSMMGFTDAGATISLQITPENSKLPLERLKGGQMKAASPQLFAEAFKRLFERLGFDDPDRLGEKILWGPYKGEFFDSAALVSNLFDYMNDENVSPLENFPDGIEKRISDKELLKNDKIEWMEELSQVPGFTSGRIQALMPFVNVSSVKGAVAGRGRQVNINVASEIVLESLHPEFEGKAGEIAAFRESEQGPFTSPVSAQLDPLGVDYQKVNALITTGSKRFEVIAKVDYGGSQAPHFVRAYVRRPDNEAAVVEFPVFY